MVLKQYCCWTWGSFVVHEVHNTIIPAMVLPGDCDVLARWLLRTWFVWICSKHVSTT